MAVVYRCDSCELTFSRKGAGEFLLCRWCGRELELDDGRIECENGDCGGDCKWCGEPAPPGPEHVAAMERLTQSVASGSERGLRPFGIEVTPIHAVKEGDPVFVNIGIVRPLTPLPDVHPFADMLAASAAARRYVDQCDYVGAAKEQQKAAAIASELLHAKRWHGWADGDLRAESARCEAAWRVADEKCLAAMEVHDVAIAEQEDATVAWHDVDEEIMRRKRSKP